MSYLTHIRACNRWDPAGFLPWRIEGQTVGMVRHAFAEQLGRWPDVFGIGADGIDVVDGLRGFDELSEALRAVVGQMVAEGRIVQAHGELYPVTAGHRKSARCVIDRAAAPYFGIRTFGQHLNGYVRTASGIEMWIGRRAADRRLFPGRLDNMVAGGLPHGVGLRENLLKECWEEAGISPEMAEAYTDVGCVSYVAETGKGLKPDTLFCYDLELPRSFEPRCTDGEVETFMLLPVEEVAATVRSSDDFKPNCNLVIIDFLVRHGIIDSEDLEYLDIVQGLHAALGGYWRPI